MQSLIIPLQNFAYITNLFGRSFNFRIKIFEIKKSSLSKITFPGYCIPVMVMFVITGKQIGHY